MESKISSATAEYLSLVEENSRSNVAIGKLQTNNIVLIRRIEAIEEIIGISRKVNMSFLDYNLLSIVWTQLLNLILLNLFTLIIILVNF